MPSEDHTCTEVSEPNMPAAEKNSYFHSLNTKTTYFAC